MPSKSVQSKNILYGIVALLILNATGPIPEIKFELTTIRQKSSRNGSFYFKVELFVKAEKAKRISNEDTHGENGFQTEEQRD